MYVELNKLKYCILIAIFCLSQHQVQFEEREDTKTCTVVINNDGIFEGPIGEDFLLELSMPTFALLGDPSLTVVTIMDPEDGT